MGIDLKRITSPTSPQGRVGANPNGTINLGIDVGIVGLGITNDYGNAIRIKVAGQEIVLGREGGQINLVVGPFEVRVEARNCVVTEVKKIAGIVVAQRSYPDPGCKVPDPPKPPTPTPTPGNNRGIDPTTLTSSALGYVLIQGTHSVAGLTFPAGWDTSPEHKGYFSVVGTTTLKSINLPDVVLPPGGAPRFTTSTTTVMEGGSSTWVSTGGGGGEFREGGLSFTMTTSTYYSSVAERTPAGDYINLYGFSYVGLGSEGPGWTGYDPPWRTYPTEKVAFGKISSIAAYIRAFNSRPVPNGMTSIMEISEVIPLGTQKPPKLFLPTGNKPPMPDSCCDELNDKLDDLHEVLHVKFFKKEMFPIPAYLLAPGTSTEQSVTAKNYYHLFQRLFQAIAHTAIVSPKVAIADSDSAKEGNQPLEIQYLSATGWAEGLTKLMLEAIDDGKVGTNMDIRTGVTVTQILTTVASLSAKLDLVIDAIGVRTVKSTVEVETAYNLMVQEGKGFSKDQQKAIDLNEDNSTEALLAKLLQTRINKIVTEVMHPKASSLLEIIREEKD